MSYLINKDEYLKCEGNCLFQNDKTIPLDDDEVYIFSPNKILKMYKTEKLSGSIINSGIINIHESILPKLLIHFDIINNDIMNLNSKVKVKILPQNLNIKPNTEFEIDLTGLNEFTYDFMLSSNEMVNPFTLNLISNDNIIINYEIEFVYALE